MSHYVPGLSQAARMLAQGSGGKSGGKGPQRKTGLAIFGDGPYPHSLDNFVGQRQARLQIVSAMTAAQKMGKPMDHMLLASGVPGIGKTTLAKLVAFHMGAGIVELAGLVGDREVAMALHVMRAGDVLFLDEVHRLVNRGKSRAEWLLTLLQDGELVTPTGVVKAPPITIIAATTDKQLLPETILDRFALQPVLEYYSDAEAMVIALTHARRMGFGVEAELPLPESRDWLFQVALACNNNPRKMGMLLTSVRNICYSQQPVTDLTGPVMAEALLWAGLTPDGLDKVAQGYLTGLYGNGGQAGIATLKALLDEEQLRHTEKLLIQKGFVTVSAKGRELTGLGNDRAQELIETAIKEMAQ